MSWISDKMIQQLRQVAELPDLTGTQYRLLERIAHGGMGVVWLALDEKLERRVALKVLDVSGEEEARILAKLEHPGIVPVHDVGRLADGRVFYTMKYIEGERLDRHVGRISGVPERLRIVHRICEAVAFAHARGVLHRDLKPENIMVGPFGEVLVMDWGLAILLRDRTPGDIGGTPGYMAPELVRGESQSLDERTDVYSLGAILQFLVAGRNTDRPLRAIIEKAIQPDPASRYANVTALASDIAAYLDGVPVAAHPESFVDSARRFLQKHRLAIGLVLAYAAVRLLIQIFFGG
jgi:eukaryotic-like serine/threonine-protein kinase